MSLLNAWIAPTAAIVAVDTDGVGQDGSRMPSSKMLPIPHLNAVLGLRGQYALLSFLFLRCISSSFDSFDEMNDALPAMLSEAEAFIPADMIVGGGIVGNELVAIGWSDREKRMVGRQFVKRGEMTAFSVTVIDHHVSPWHPSMQSMRIAPHEVDKIARAQVRWMRATFPNAACGGHLIVCKLSRKEMTLSRKFNFQGQEIPA